MSTPKKSAEPEVTKPDEDVPQGEWQKPVPLEEAYPPYPEN